MLKQLADINRFLVSQLLYPIILSTLLALSLYAARVYLTHSWVVYANLVWNLFLAWIPYIFSFIAAGLNRLFPKAWWLLVVPGFLWLIFFPNAAYIVTDFLHLKQRLYVPLWYDILLLASFTWTGIFLAIASLRTIQTLIQKYLGWLVGWVFVGIAMGLSGLGIYLGRFDRFNSWDLLIHPRRILLNVMMRFTEPADNLRFFGFTLLITAFLLVCYLTFVSVNRNSEE